MLWEQRRYTDIMAEVIIKFQVNISNLCFQLSYVN